MKKLFFYCKLFIISALFPAYVNGQCSANWVYKQSMPSADGGITSAVIGNEIYVLGGYQNGTRNVSFNTQTNTWTTHAALPYSMFRGMAASANGKVYIFGGQTGSPNSNSTFEYNPATNSWSNKTNMPTGRAYATAVQNNGLIYIIGGRTSGSGGADCATTEVYNPNTDTWQTKANMPGATAYFSGGVANNKIYVFGGTGNAYAVYRYDIAANTWATLPNMPINRIRHSVANAGNSLVFIAGEIQGGTDSVYFYNTITGQWTPGPRLNFGRIEQTAQTVGDTVYVIGGAGYNFGNLTATTEALCLNQYFCVPTVSISRTKDSICSGTSVTFTATIANGGTSPAFQWKLNGATVGSNSSSFTSTSLNNSDTIQCTLTSNAGCVTQNTVNSNALFMTVLAKPSFSTSTTGSTTFCAGDSITLQVSSAQNITYQWKLNSINISNANTASYTAKTTGTYKSILTGTNGCVDSTAPFTVTVNPKPVSSFSTNNSSQCKNNNNFQFSNASSISSGTITHLWQFGDNQSSSLTSPGHSYSVAGTYSVKLATTSNLGCKDSALVTVTVNPNPAAVFSTNNLAECFKNNSFQFSNSSTISSGINSYFWSFGDNSTSAVTNPPAKSYSNSGTFTVSLSVTSDKGCTDSVSKQITVYPSPTAGFNINDTGQCLKGNNFVFTNTSSITSGNLSYRWELGNGNTSTQNNVTYTYPQSGTYSIKLIPLSDKGCTDTFIRMVSVHPNPPAPQVQGQPEALAGNPTLYNATPATAGYTYHWFTSSNGIIRSGQGNDSIQASWNDTVTAHFGLLKVIAIDGFGCASDTALLTIRTFASGIEQPTATATLRIYPNPAGGHFTAELPEYATMPQRVELVNETGLAFALPHIFRSSGTPAVEVDASGLSPGIYLLRILSGTQLLQTKIVIAR